MQVKKKKPRKQPDTCPPYLAADALHTYLLRNGCVRTPEANAAQGSGLFDSIREIALHVLQARQRNWAALLPLRRPGWPRTAATDRSHPTSVSFCLIMSSVHGMSGLSGPRAHLRSAWAALLDPTQHQYIPRADHHRLDGRPALANYSITRAHGRREISSSLSPKRRHGYGATCGLPLCVGKPIVTGKRGSLFTRMKHPSS